MIVAHQTLRDGLVGAWCPSLGASQPISPDLSGLGNTATITGVLRAQRGNVGVSVASGTAITMPNAPGIADGNFTLSMWFYYSASGGPYTAIVDKQASGLREFSIFLDGTTGSASLIEIGASSAANVNMGIATFLWQHLAVARAGSTVSFYRDGVLVSTATMSGTTLRANSTWAFGSNPSGGGGVPSGLYDDIRIYKRALTEPEIKTLAMRPGIGLRSQRQRRYRKIGNQWFIRIGGYWKPAESLVNVAGTWKTAEGFVKVGGVWR